MRVRTVDLAVVAVLLVVVGLGSAHVQPGAAGLVLGLLGVGALVFWRGHPVSVALVAATTVGVYLGQGYHGGPALLAGPLSMLALGYRAPRRLAWLGAGAMFLSSSIGQYVAADGFDSFHAVIIGWVLASLLAGQALRARGERAAAEHERHTHQVLEVQSAERLRIAQDLHDSVAHAMATINVQSGVAAHLMDKQPEQVRAALEAIRSASGSVLDELGAILGALREADDVPRAPVPGLTGVADLVERARADGLRASLTVRGDVEKIATSVGRAAYRVVQEALTNSRRHAGAGAAATVTITARPAVLCVEVDDDGAGSADSAGGFGLLGMRERVESTGGSLTVGPLEPHGYRVVANWPAAR